jgi:hypothetical protein
METASYELEFVVITTMAFSTNSMPAAAASMARASNFLALPFDLAREQYALAVKSGLIEKSLLKSAKFGRDLKVLEQLTLGPLARTH